MDGEQNESEEEFNMHNAIAHQYFAPNPTEIVRGGSVSTRKYKHRNRKVNHDQLMADYFVPKPIYDAGDFRCRFRTNRSLFLHLVEACERSNTLFQQKLDRKAQLGFSLIHKITVAMRMLAYAYSVDAIDEIFAMGKTTMAETMREFFIAILKLYENKYFRAPTKEDLARLLDRAERRGLHGMIDSLDCMHWTWKNCPTSWQESFTGRKHKATIILEAVASGDTWI